MSSYAWWKIKAVKMQDREEKQDYTVFPRALVTPLAPLVIPVFSGMIFVSRVLIRI
jgi:hypothetical protein